MTDDNLQCSKETNKTSTILYAGITVRNVYRCIDIFLNQYDDQHIPEYQPNILYRTMHVL